MNEEAVPLDLGEEPTTGALHPFRADHPLAWHETAAERNRQRGLYAGVGITAYAELVYSTAGEPLEQAIGDLLGDLRHLCDAVSLNYDELNERGRRHYDDEIGGEG